MKIAWNVRDYPEVKRTNRWYFYFIIVELLNIVGRLVGLILEEY